MIREKPRLLTVTTRLNCVEVPIAVNELGH